MLKVGIIDLGTNTFNLLIAEIDDAGGYKPLYRSKVGVKLGEGSFAKNYITEEAMERAMVALDAQISAVQNQYCDRILAFATSAVRSATNGDQFVQKVYDRFKVRIKVIDGDHEASMIFQGVQLAGALTSEPALIMDIGGGSTEFIIANDEEIIWKESYEVGVSRLLEKFEPDDPVTFDQITEIESFLRNKVTDLIEHLKLEKVDTLIGSSGSFDTFYDVLAAREGKYIENPIESTGDFDLEDFNALLNEIIAADVPKREAMEGMVQLRVKMIPMSALFVRMLMQAIEFKEVKLSRYALKEGVLFDVLKGNL